MHPVNVGDAYDRFEYKLIGRVAGRRPLEQLGGALRYRRARFRSDKMPVCPLLRGGDEDKSAHMAHV